MEDLRSDSEDPIWPKLLPSHKTASIPAGSPLVDRRQVLPSLRDLRKLSCTATMYQGVPEAGRYVLSVVKRRLVVPPGVAPATNRKRLCA